MSPTNLSILWILLNTTRKASSGEAGFQGDGVAAKDVPARIHPPEQEGLIGQLQELAHQRCAVLHLVHVDVPTLEMRVDAEADGLARGHPDHNLEAFGVREPLRHHSGEVERLLLALLECDVYPWAEIVKQFPEFLPRRDA